LAGIFQQDLAGTLLVLTSPPTSERMSVSPKSFFLEKAMNYYPFHLGDYASHTGHLDPMEDLAYRRMLDAYYLREGQLPKDVTEIARLVRLRDDAATIRDVLNEFFEQTPEGWRHIRCDEEILKMQDKQAKARASAHASVNARRAKAQQPQSESQADAEQTLNERSTDVQLPTPTPTPIPNKEYICPPSGEPAVKDGLPECQHQAVIDLYHQHLPTLRRVEVWNAARQGYLRQRWREVAWELANTKTIVAADVLNWWAEFFQHVAKSRFLTGRIQHKDGRAFAADLEWIVKPSNFAKIVEGKYHGV
jgi:uncharacterized protein YdaU (DUF1376 family)